MLFLEDFIFFGVLVMIFLFHKYENKKLEPYELKRQKIIDDINKQLTLKKMDDALKNVIEREEYDPR